MVLNRQSHRQQLKGFPLFLGLLQPAAAWELLPDNTRISGGVDGLPTMESRGGFGRATAALEDGLLAVGQPYRTGGGTARGAVGSREAQLRRNVQGTPRGCGTAPSTPCRQPCAGARIPTGWSGSCAPRRDGSSRPS